MNKYNVIVIGAGNGGLGAAISLAEKGMKPLVIEQHNLPGGCATSFVRGRFEWDASLHALFYDLPFFRPNWEGRFGISENMMQIPEVFTNIYKDKEGKLIREEYPLGVESFIGTVCQKHPASAQAIQQFFGLCIEVVTAPKFEPAVSALGNRKEVNPEAIKDITPEQVAEKFPNYEKFSKLSVKEVYNEVNAPEELQQLLSVFWWYLGPSIEEMPFTAYAELLLGFLSQHSYFPEHTCHGYTSEFEKKIRQYGGDVWYNTEVTEILVKDGKISGVITNQGDTIETDYIVSNAGPKTVYGKLIKSDSEQVKACFDAHKNIDDAFSFTQIYLGMNVTAEELGIKHHHIFMNESQDAMDTYRSTKDTDGPMLIGVLCPNLTIPDFSPEGTCALTLGVPMFDSVLNGMSQKEYFKEKNRLAEDIIKRASKLLEVDLFEHIEEMVITTPATWARYVNLPGGALGYDLTIENMKKQFGITAKNIEGLHFVGQFEFGIGYPNNGHGVQVGDQVASKIKGE